MQVVQLEVCVDKGGAHCPSPLSTEQQAHNSLLAQLPPSSGLKELFVHTTGEGDGSSIIIE